MMRYVKAFFWAFGVFGASMAGTLGLIVFGLSLFH